MNDKAKRFDLVRRAVDERDDEEEGADGAFDHEPNGNASVDRTVVFEDGAHNDIGHWQHEDDGEEEERDESEANFFFKSKRKIKTKIMKKLNHKKI